MNLKEISINDFDVKIGQAENDEAGTGVTVIVAPKGAPCGLDIRGGGPASRESGLMDPLATADIIHAVVLGRGCAPAPLQHQPSMITGVKGRVLAAVAEEERLVARLPVAEVKEICAVAAPLDISCPP